MPKLLCNFIKFTLRHGCSPVNLLQNFRKPLPKNTSEWLLLRITAIKTPATLFHYYSNDSCLNSETRIRRLIQTLLLNLKTQECH